MCLTVLDILEGFFQKSHLCIRHGRCHTVLLETGLGSFVLS